MQNKIKKFIVLGTIIAGGLFTAIPAFAAAPTMITMAATSVTQTQATVNGAFMGNGPVSTDVRFEYGTTVLLGSSTAYVTQNNSGAAFSATLSNLSPNTIYWYRAMGVNGDGPGHGTILSFTTAGYNDPSVLTRPATSITGTSATLNGSYIANGSSTDTTFEYANNIGLIGSTTLPFVTQGTTGGNYSKTITGLTANTTYYFRAVARNSGNTVYGVTLPFTTTSGSYSSCTIGSFTASPSSVTSGNSATLSWNTSNCNNASISSIGSVSVNGNVSTGALYATTTYTLSANDGSSFPTQSITVVVTNNNSQVCVINSFYASPSTINQYSSSTLNWSTSNCTSVSISNIGSVNTSGNTNTGSLANTTTFTITASGNSGNPSSSTTVIVNNQNNTQYCTINSFYASPSYLSQSGYATLYWSTNNCNSASISNVGSVNTNGSTSTGYLTNTTTFILNAYGTNGNQTSSTTVTVNNNNGNNNGGGNNYGNTLSVVTTVATSISKSSAKLHGLVTNGTGANATGWFEYGTSYSLGNSTSVQSLGSTNSFDFPQTITGLTSDTTYYFRVVAQNSYGLTFKGGIESFTTLPASSSTTYYTNNTTDTNNTGNTTTSLVALSIDTALQSVHEGDTVSYVITYTNISKSTLNNTVLNVKLPQAVDFTGSTAGMYSIDNHSLTYTIGTLHSKDTGTITMQGTVNNKGNDHDTLVTTATLTYVLTNGAQDTAIAYATQSFLNNGNVLGAAAIFGSGFWPNSIWAWIIFAIIIYLIIHYGRKVYIHTWARHEHTIATK